MNPPIDLNKKVFKPVAHINLSWNQIINDLRVIRKLEFV